MDIICRTCALFDRVIVAVMENYHKPARLFSPEERVDMLRRCTDGLPNVEVLASGGLLAELARAKGAAAVVKGLRAVTDFEVEFQQALTNNQLNPNLETVFLTAGAESMFLSSSVVKQVALGGGDISRFVPNEVLDEVMERVREKLN